MPYKLVTFSAVMSMFVFAALGNILPSALFYTSDTLQCSPVLLTQTTSMQFFAFFIATVTASILSDYFGKRIIFQISCFLLCAGCVLWTTLSRFETAIVAGTLMGMGGGVLEGLGSAILAQAHPRKAKLFLNLSQAAYCLGAIFMPFLMSKMLPAGISWRLFFAVVGGLCIILLISYSFSRMPDINASERVQWKELPRLFGSSMFWLPCILIFFYVLSETCIVIYINYYLQDVCHAPEVWAIASLSAFWLAMLAGRVACAFFPEKWPTIKIICAMLCSGALLLACQAWVTDWQASVVLFVFTGLAFAGIWPLIVSLTALWHQKNSGTAVGVTVAIGALGCVTAPFFMKFLFWISPPGEVYLFVALPLFFFGILGIFWSKSTQRRNEFICVYNNT